MVVTETLVGGGIDLFGNNADAADSNGSNYNNMRPTSGGSPVWQSKSANVGQGNAESDPAFAAGMLNGAGVKGGDGVTSSGNATGGLLAGGGGMVFSGNEPMPSGGQGGRGGGGGGSQVRGYNSNYGNRTSTTGGAGCLLWCKG